MKKQTIVVDPLGITWLEQAWQHYQESKGSGLAQLMGEQVGLLLQEIRILRTQVKDLQVQVNDIEADLQNAYDYYDL